MAEQTVRPGQRAAMSQAELEQLPASFDLEVANRAWGLGRTLGYALAKRDEYPCRVHRIAGKYRVTRADLLRSLGVSTGQAAA